MPKSRALKDEAMPMMERETPESMMKDAKETMMSGRNSMMRGQVMMMGAKAMQGIMKKKKMPDEDMMQYSDLGGLNFDPKKMRKKGKK